MITQRFLLFFLLGFTISCTQDTDKAIEQNLLSYGIPLKIMVPDSVKVTKSTLGSVIDLTMKTEDNSFNVQILGSDATTTDVDKLHQKKKEEVKALENFTAIVKEDDDGFIYELTMSDGQKDYNFYSVKIKGDKEYSFETSFLGFFTQEQVEIMYGHINQAIKK